MCFEIVDCHVHVGLGMKKVLYKTGMQVRVHPSLVRAWRAIFSIGYVSIHRARSFTPAQWYRPTCLASLGGLGRYSRPGPQTLPKRALGSHLK